MKRLGLVLGAGGSRGIAHIGFLKALEENDIKVYCISGCSMGALVGACYAGGMSALNMRQEIEKFKMRNIIDIPLLPFRKGGIFRSKKFRNKISNTLPCKTFEDLEMPFSCVATDLLSKQTVTFSSGDLTNAVIASCTIPSLFRPLEFNNMLLVDGGVKCRMPIKQAKELGAEAIVALDVLGFEEKRGKKLSTINLMLKVVDIVDEELTNINRNSEKCDLYLEPNMFGLSQYKLKDPISVYNVGYKLGFENAEKIKKLLT